MPPSSTRKAAITYADAGVDISRAKRTKQRIKYLAQKTYNRGVLSQIGGFAGMFALDKKKYRDPVLVSSVDGVGTKLKIAFEMNLHHSVGADLVSHCVNDIVVQGAAPLFFMDYLATGNLDPEVAEKVVGGIAESCKHNNCALIGGETAEMPGFYADGEYDLAGFIVGIVDRERILTGKKVQAGDVLIGLPSTGLHTNGYSLARKLLFGVAGHNLDTYVNELKNKVGNELMRPHKSYWPAVRRLIDSDTVVAMAHVTGGGITNWPWRRRITSQVAIMLAKPLTRVRDITSGYFFCRRSVIDGVQLDPIGFKIGLEVIMKGNYRNVQEVPYVFTDRALGKSKLNSSEIVNYLKQLSKIYFGAERRSAKTVAAPHPLGQR